VVAAALLAATIGGCGAVDGTASLGSDTAPGLTVPEEIIRVAVVINNDTAETVIVDMAIDGAFVSYPISPNDVISLRLKCADVFALTQVRYEDIDNTAPVGQEVLLNIDYDCNDILLINIDNQGGQLGVVPVE
jgi:hypothetical protein